MAYTVLMTKKSVVQQGNLYNITVNCIVNNGEIDVFDIDISQQYNTNAANLDTLIDAILDELKAKWDKYIDEKTILDSAAMDTALSTMQSQAQTYVNQ